MDKVKVTWQNGETTTVKVDDIYESSHTKWHFEGSGNLTFLRVSDGDWFSTDANKTFFDDLIVFFCEKDLTISSGDIPDEKNEHSKAIRVSCDIISVITAGLASMNWIVLACVGSGV